MDFTELVATRLPSLTPDTARVASFLLEQPHRLGHLSAARIGEEVGVSDATVIRTVRSLGFDSLDDMRERVASELSPQRRLDATLRAPSRGGSLVEQLVEQRCDDVAHLADRVRGDDPVAAVRILARAKRLIVVGFGPSGFLAGYTAHHARRLGIAARAVTATGSDLADELLDVRPTDGFVVLSYDPPGGPVDVVLSQAAAAGAVVVLVTDVPSRRAATVVLPVGRGDPRHVASHAATLAVLESVVLALAARHDRPADAAAGRLRELRADIHACRAFMAGSADLRCTLTDAALRLDDEGQATFPPGEVVARVTSEAGRHRLTTVARRCTFCSYPLSSVRPAQRRVSIGMTDSSDSSSQRDDVRPPGHPAAEGDALSGGEVISGETWRAGGAVGSSPRPRTDRVPNAGDDEQDMSSEAPPDRSDPAPEHPPTDDGPDAASDVAQFLDVDPPASPASQSDAAAPG